MTQPPEMARLVERAKIQDALEYGKAVLVRDGERSLPVDIIWFLLCEAAATERALPDRERGWLSRNRSSDIPEAVHTPEELWEAFSTEVERIKAGIESADVLAVKGPPPTPEAIERWHVVMRWFQYVPGKGNKKARNRRVLFALADGASGPKISRTTGVHRNTAYAIRDTALRAISHKIYQIAFSSPQGVDGLGKSVQHMEHV
ncbi:DUF6362 family protein [Pyruvatibacter mobilis]|uniref:DUF6362 family protein n=1 Tax=Pyruvatibacter mobilis TaxID=1712261 RepID=UPI003BAF1BC4